MIPVVRDEWIQFCLEGNQEINREVASNGLRWIYGLAKLDAPFVIFVDGPMACQYAASFIRAMVKDKKLTAQVGDQVLAGVRDQVVDQVVAQVVSQVRDQVVDQVGDQVVDQVVDQVGDQVVSQVRDQVRAQVRAQVVDQVGDQVRAQVVAQVVSQVVSQVGAQVVDQVVAQVGDQAREKYELFSWCDLSDAGWISCSDFLQRIGIKFDGKFDHYKKYVRSGVFMTIFLNGFAIACPRPKSVYRNERNQLHRDMRPAIQWKNEDYFFLNGVRVPKDYVLTPPEKIDVQKVIKEENVEIRRELIRKIGIERYIQKIGAKVLDKQGDYELLSVKLSDEITDALFLKMKNPSTGVWHVEGVEGATVQEAINWRAGDIKRQWNPAILT